jgi:hypothetical protein
MFAQARPFLDHSANAIRNVVAAGEWLGLRM